MHFCLPLIAHAPLHHGLSRCSRTEALAGLLQFIVCAIPQVQTYLHSFKHFACGFYAGAQAARDALQRTRAQVVRGTRVDTLFYPQLCQGPLAVCCNIVQAQPVGNRPALKEDAVACALVVFKILLQQTRLASQYCGWYSVSASTGNKHEGAAR